MKTTPTDIDREAAQLFVAAPGMRVQVDAQDDALVRIDWCRVAESTWAGGLLLHRLSSSQALASCVDIVAIDTDDPATVGVMLAQVEAKKHEILSAGDRTPVDARWVWTGPHVLGFEVVFEEDELLGEGPTRGAALVAAMRQIRRGVTP